MGKGRTEICFRIFFLKAPKQLVKNCSSGCGDTAGCLRTEGSTLHCLHGHKILGAAWWDVFPWGQLPSTPVLHGQSERVFLRVNHLHLSVCVMSAHNVGAVNLSHSVEVLLVPDNWFGLLSFTHWSPARLLERRLTPTCKDHSSICRLFSWALSKLHAHIGHPFQGQSMGFPPHWCDHPATQQEQWCSSHLSPYDNFPCSEVLVLPLTKLLAWKQFLLKHITGFILKCTKNMSLHLLFTMMLRFLLPLIFLPLLRRFSCHVGKEEGSNIKQQEYKWGIHIRSIWMREP